MKKRFPLAPPPPFRNYQVCAVNALRGIGPESRGLVIEALHKGRPEVRATCAWALGGFETNSLVNKPGFPEDEIRDESLKALRKIDPVTAEKIAGELHLKLSRTDKQ